MIRQKKILDLSEESTESAEPEYPHCHFIDFGGYKSPPTGFLDDDYAKILVLQMVSNKELVSPRLENRGEASWERGQFYNDRMKSNKQEIITLSSSDMKQTGWSWVESAQRSSHRMFDPSKYSSSLPYVYPSVQICTTLATNCIFKSNASEYSRKVNRDFVHKWNTTSTAAGFGILENGTYRCVYKCSPLACIVHDADSKHFSVIITIDGNKWYHFDSTFSGLNNRAVVDGLENARILLMTAFLDGFIEARPPNKFQIVHMSQSGNGYPTHAPVLQFDGVSCLLYAIATLDFFVRTKFNTFPVIEALDGVYIQSAIPEMRKFCISLFHDSYAYYNRVRSAQTPSLSQPPSLPPKSK